MISADKIIKRPMVKWAALGSIDPKGEALAVIGNLDAIAIRAARLSAYLNARWYGGRPHAEALRAQNKAASKVRAALGYSYPKDDLTF